MVKIDLLKNHPQAAPRRARIWQENLGKIWFPDIPVEEIITRFEAHVNDVKLPIEFITLDGGVPIGICALREHDGIRPHLSPWLGSLIVDLKYQKQGISKLLVDAVVEKARHLGFEKLYLFAVDPAVPQCYERLGWNKIGTDTFKTYPVTVMERGL